MAKAQWHGEIFKRNLENPKREYLMKCGFYVEGEAKRICPVDTGTLRSSIHTKFNPLEVAAYVGTSAERMTSLSGTMVFYAPYVEFGHYLRNGRWQPPQPFLRPALDALRTKVAIKGTFLVRNPI